MKIIFGICVRHHLLFLLQSISARITKMISPEYAMWNKKVMIYEFDSFDAYHAACEKDPSMRGMSPGGAASHMSVTRQAVFNAIRRGTLDLVRITEQGTGPFLIIPDGSRLNYSLNHLGKKGPRPGFRHQLQMQVDKHVHLVWPD